MKVQWQVIVKTMQGRTANQILLRATGFVVASLLPAITTFLWSMAVSNPGYPNTDFLIAIILTIVLTAVSFITMAIIIVPLAFVYVFSGGLAVSEYVVRRIAESRKGPILALSIILATIGGFGKLFGY